MGSTTQVTINGVTYTVNWEYTTGTVQNQALSSLQYLVQLLQQSDASAVQSYLQNPTNLTNIRNALQNLASLVQNGANVNGQQSYVTIHLAQTLDEIFKTFNAAGINLSFSNPALAQNITAGQLRAWWELALQSPTVNQAVQTAVSSAQTATRTLQSMVELDYIAYGNKLLADQLENMQKALGITNDVLNILSDLQTLHNQLGILSTQKLSDIFNLSGLNNAENPSAWIGMYLNAASTVFGQPISPQLLSGVTSTMLTSTFIANIHKIIQLKEDLKTQISAIKALDNNSSQASLLGRLESVYNDLSRTLGSTTTVNTPVSQVFAGFRNWVLDNYSSFGGSNASLAGAIQNNITSAITAAQSLNDTQKQTVQQYLTLFQQYYQSASSILDSITQIIEKMAQNISR